MGNDLTVDFSRGGNGIDHCGTGWAEPEGTGVWMMGQQSLLVLPRPEISGDYRLELDLGALTGPGHPSQRLVVGVNGAVMGEFVLETDGIEHCMLPWPVIGREPGLTLVLSHPDAWRPSELTGGEGDHRELSLFLGQLRLSLHEAAPAASPAATASAAPVPAAQAPVPQSPPVQTPSAPVVHKPAVPAPAAAAPAPAAPSAASPPVVTQPAIRPTASGPAPAAQAAPSSQVPAPRLTPAPAATRPAAPAQEARVPWWKKLLG